VVKATVDPTATRRVLADIDAAVRPVEHARTAAAVERVLRTASCSLYEPADARRALWELYEEFELTDVVDDLCDFGECSWCDEAEPVDDLLGLRVCACWGLCLLLPLTAACAPAPELTYTRSFDATGIEEGAAWGGFVLFTQWWEETS
jgi:hypothetical protein